LFAAGKGQRLCVIAILEPDFAQKLVSLGGLSRLDMPTTSAANATFSRADKRGKSLNS
jgi:hypothetical protein